MILRLRFSFYPALFLLFLALPVMTQAQQAAQQPERMFRTAMRAVSETAGIAGKTRIVLWGVSEAGVMRPTLALKARVALDNMIGKQKVECTLKEKTADALIAQCNNSNDVDLGLFMLQNGFVLVDRSAIYNTVFEAPYLQAEAKAQSREIGIWDENQRAVDSGTNSNLMLTLGFILFLCMIGAFAVLSLFIMRGFQRTIEAQNQNMDITSKERILKDKERKIFASMLDTEIKANKSKIEAYLLVYDEMLKALQDPDKPPKYQTAGDIVQEQPALSREVFDLNADKLDVLGRDLASEVIHFYARIKTNPDFLNLEPDLPLGDAVEIVEKAINNANRLNIISEKLIDLFVDSGLSSSNF